LTEEMEKWVSNRLDRLEEIHGFILKAKSPSCGMGDVKVYGPTGRGLISGKEDGFFGREVRRRYPNLAVEDEARLSDNTILDHFLTKLFTIARFHEYRRKGEARDLIEFHSRHKFLLMAYSQKELREMGGIVATQKEKGTGKAWDLYSIHLLRALAKGAKYTSHINVLTHCFGFVSERLERAERGFFLDLVEAYRDDRVPLSTCKEVIRAMILRFDVEYLKDQFYFRPYPVELAPGYDPKRNRELWR
ncbi:MAG: YbgA family protein, partial [Thermoplasmatota archaeon]